ncbi:hypothetical protein POX_e06978 [Penicillium oxalicum]|uniref:Uncharacterized protein n=1 Tax=Penicillium oxalicum (strain 114-2 / CGMCC 5302) TaxID=933388 RepID=S8APZ3_PENO1|nr:hypothetical protein POX_e06978 [Penicillium oxalicum]EPS28008.1 hypothetical protein PDE_02953 [Penicillium oxalicum 114-2]KAI2788953.1 hypothetical protein POX_e06978 [Penicillium oxalicum]
MESQASLWNADGGSGQSTIDKAGNAWEYFTARSF